MFYVFAVISFFAAKLEKLVNILIPCFFFSVVVLIKLRNLHGIGL